VEKPKKKLTSSSSSSNIIIKINRPKRVEKSEITFIVKRDNVIISSSSSNWGQRG